MARIGEEYELLLKAVEQMPIEQLNAFVARVLALRAQREAPTLSATESALLLRINSAIPEALQQRYDELVARRRAEQLTPVEHAELLQLTVQIEDRDVDRVVALRELAQLRNISLTDLLDSLGIQPSYV